MQKQRSFSHLIGTVFDLEDFVVVNNDVESYATTPERMVDQGVVGIVIWVIDIA